MKSVQKKFISETRKELAASQGDLAVIDESIRAANDRVARTALRSPVRGIVNRINTTTVGAVAQSGQDIMEIVPLDDTLLIEAQTRPEDVAFLHPGQTASVKIMAYDYTIYGSLDGQVERISADTITDTEGRKFYRAIVRSCAPVSIRLAPRTSPCRSYPEWSQALISRPGRRRLDYILKPIRKAQKEVLRER